MAVAAFGEEREIGQKRELSTVEVEIPANNPRCDFYPMTPVQ